MLYFLLIFDCQFRYFCVFCIFIFHVACRTSSTPSSISPLCLVITLKKQNKDQEQNVGLYYNEIKAVTHRRDDARQSRLGLYFLLTQSRERGQH